ncbi:hypothetical protein BH18GEM1_BH18GEM1_02030 [soil metagenome]
MKRTIVTLACAVVVAHRAAACSRDVTSPPEESRRALVPAADAEGFGQVFLNGQFPTSASRYSVRFFPKAGFDKYYMG